MANKLSVPDKLISRLKTLILQNDISNLLFDLSSIDKNIKKNLILIIPLAKLKHWKISYESNAQILELYMTKAYAS